MNPANDTTSPDKLIQFREVYPLIGSTCKTGHRARTLAARGQIRAVRLNERTILYSKQSVLDLVAGRAPAVSATQVAATQQEAATP